MKILEVQADTGETVTVAEIADPDWVEMVARHPRRWRDGWLTIQEHGATCACCITAHQYRRPTSGFDLSWTLEENRSHIPLEDPKTIELWSYDQDGHKLHSDGDGVAFLQNGSHSVLITQRSSMQHPATTTVGKGDDLWVIDSLAAAPLVEPDVDSPTGHLQSHTAVVLPTMISNTSPILLDPTAAHTLQRVMKSRNSYLLSQWFANQGFCVVITDGPGTPGRQRVGAGMIRGDLATHILQAQIEALQEVSELYSDQVDPSAWG